MDIYVDFNNELKLFYEYLREDGKKEKLKKVLAKVDLNSKEDRAKCDFNNMDLNLVKAVKFYKECLLQINNNINSEHITFCSKRNERYVDKDTFEFCEGFGTNKRYLIPIVDRLNELQIHQISKEVNIIDQVKSIIELYDDAETLFSCNLSRLSELEKIDLIHIAKELIGYKTKGIKRIVYDDSQEEKILFNLREYDLDNSLLSNVQQPYSIDFKLGNPVTFFSISSIQFRLRQYHGVISEIKDNEAKIILENNKKVNIPLKSLIKTKTYNINSPVNSPINWYGGKYYLANDIIDIFPEGCNKYVEVFGGAAHILLKKKLEKGENVYNDINKGLYTFFKVLADDKKKKQLMHKFTLTPYHQGVWEESLKWNSEEKEVEMARKFYTETMQSRSSNGGWSFTRSKKYSRRNMAASVSKWLGNIENNIHRAVIKLSKITIENNSFEECIKKHDALDTLFYLDPPYVPDTRTYKKGYLYEMSIEQHEQLVDILLAIKGKVVLSGYDNEVYRRLEKEGKFVRILIKEVIKSSINTNREAYMGTEYVWVNFDISSPKYMKYILRELLIPSFESKKSNKVDLDLLQVELNYVLPKDYYDFLYNYNGGKIKADISSIVEHKRNIYLKELYGIEVIKNMVRIDKEYIYIGKDTDSNEICISTRNNKIYLKELGQYIEIAESFTKFILTCFNMYRYYADVIEE